MPAVPLDRRRVLASLAALAALPALAHGQHDAAQAPPPLPVPGDSVYRLPATLQDQDGRSFEWSSLQGRPVIATMFYASCDMVCPMIFETIQLTLRELPAAPRSRVKVLMASFDPERDTPEHLQRTARLRGCGPGWILARADDATTRQLAAVLGVQYRRLASGEYNHSSLLELLDPAGRIVARTGKLGQVDPAFVRAIRNA